MNAILHDRLYDFPPNELLARQARQESNARSYPRRLPLALKRARGIRVEDVEGRVFIDCLAGAGTLALGHNHPVVVQAMRRVLDDDLSLLPVRATGELHAAGFGVARGYLGDPALTALRFIPDPFGDGGRLYRTGDLARWNGQGQLDFQGRSDQ